MKAHKEFTVTVDGLPVVVTASVTYRLGYAGETASANVKVLSVSKLARGGVTSELQQVTKGIIAQVDKSGIYDIVAVQY